MGTKTTRLDLSKPGENDYYNQQTEQADNWQKVDDYAVYTDRDKNAIWGGLDGGGLIEDPSVTKVVGKRYIGADGKGYICKVPSDINNSTNYTPCNVVDNLDKLQNLDIDYIVEKEYGYEKWSSGKFVQYGTAKLESNDNNTIYFKKPFFNNKYFLVFAVNFPNGEKSNVAPVIFNKSINGASFYRGQSPVSTTFIDYIAYGTWK